MKKVLIILTLLLVFTVPGFASASERVDFKSVPLSSMDGYETGDILLFKDTSATDPWIMGSTVFIDSSNPNMQVTNNGWFFIVSGLSPTDTITLSSTKDPITDGSINLEFRGGTTDAEKTIFSSGSFNTSYFSKQSGSGETPDPDPNPDDGGGENPMEPEIGGTNMFDTLTSAAITTEATTWAGNFDALLLVVVGVGIGFACVRFVKSLFF